VRLGLEDLLAVIHSLDEPSRARVAHALAETEMGARFKDLITHLAARAPVAVAGRWRSPVAAGRHLAEDGCRRRQGSGRQDGLLVSTQATRHQELDTAPGSLMLP